MRYTIINPDGTVKGTQTLTDAMADRFEDRGYHLIPEGNLPSVKITFGTKR